MTNNIDYFLATINKIKISRESTILVMIVVPVSDVGFTMMM